MSEQNNSANNFNAAKSDQFSNTGLTANAQLSKARQAPAKPDRPNFLKFMEESDQRVKEIQARNEPSPPPTGPSQPTAEMVNLLLSSPEAYRAQLIGDLLTAVGPYTQRSIFRDFQSSQSQYHSETPNWQTPDPKILPRKEYSHQKASVFNPSGSYPVKYYSISIEYGQINRWLCSRLPGIGFRCSHQARMFGNCSSLSLRV